MSLPQQANSLPIGKVLCCLAESCRCDQPCLVSGDYQIVQPKEVLEFYRELTELYGYTLETAGALDGGRKVWALARTSTTGTADTGGKDKLAAYILLATSCDKTLAPTAAYVIYWHASAESTC